VGVYADGADAAMAGTGLAAEGADTDLFFVWLDECAMEIERRHALGVAVAAPLVEVAGAGLPAANKVVDALCKDPATVIACLKQLIGSASLTGKFIPSPATFAYVAKHMMNGTPPLGSFLPFSQVSDSTEYLVTGAEKLTLRTRCGRGVLREA